MDKIDKLIQIVRDIKEEAMGVGAISGPTNKTGKAIAGLPPDSPPVNLVKKRKNIYLGLGSRKRWME